MRWRAAGGTLFGRTAATIALALILFQLFALAAVAWYVLLPVGRRSADDLAALMVLSAQTWVELPPGTRDDFTRELLRQHGLRLLPADAHYETTTTYLPYLIFLRASLSQRLDREIEVHTAKADPPWFWADIPMAEREIRIAFERARIGARPPVALLLVLVAGAALTVATTLIVVRRITWPLARLAQATERIGRGDTPEPLPERGPRELAQLARRFNEMAAQVRELLANRTTLLAGISHDLRTPIARMRLAVEMLPATTDPQLVQGLARDLDDMNRLIGQFLELSRGLEHDTRQATDICTLIGEVVNDARRAGAAVAWQTPGACRRDLPPLALRRILTNLIDNAQRYGAGAPIEVRCDCAEAGVTIRILDRGPGIPADQREAVFRPFHRLETSRSADTGGSGLGLAVARQLAQAQGWEVTLHAREGGGMEARVVLAT